MHTLVLGLLLFLGLHLVPAAPTLRGRLIGSLGPRAYKLAYSALAVIGIVLIVHGYREAHWLGRDNVELWTAPQSLRHLTLLLMLPALILLAAAYIPSRIRTYVKHPMLAAIFIWGLAHLLMRGDVASVMLFGGFLAYALVDRLSVTKRVASGPLGAAQGGPRGDVAAILVGGAAYTTMLLWAHGGIIGAPLLR